MTTSPPPAGAPDAPPAAPPPASGASRFFDWLRTIPLTREPGWLGGVASGIALRLRIDPLIVRGILVVLAIFAFPVGLLYALAWAFLPDHTGRVHAEDVSRGRVESGFIGAVIVLVLSLFGLDDGGPWLWGPFDWPGSFFAGLAATVWTILVLGGLAWLVVWLVRRSTAPAAAPVADGARLQGDAAPRTPPASAEEDATTTAVMPTTPLLETAADDDLGAWRAQQHADRAQRDAFASESDAARRQAEAERLAAEHRARGAEIERQRVLRRRTRSHPLYSVAAIGLALVAGAVVTLVVGGLEVERGDIVLGFAVALGVLGAAIVINGVRGKRSGGSTGAAILALIGLAIAGASPGPGSTLRFVGEGAYAPVYLQDDEQSFVVGAGSTVVDLADYWDGTRAGAELDGTVTIVAGAGDITVVLPEAGSVEWDIVSGSGDARLLTGSAPGGGRPIASEGGTSATGETERMLTLDVISGAGDILFTTEGTER